MIYTETAVTRYLASWCKKHLGQHDSLEYQIYHRAFASFLRFKRAEQSQKHDNAGLFGMSGAGGCLRANALKRAGVPGRPEDGDSMVTFEIGHLLECAALAILSASGFGVTRSQEVVRLEPAFQSAIDGVLVAGPVKLEYPLVLSVKTASYKSSSPPRGNYPAKRYGFAGLPLDGIRAAEPGYFIQSQLEMMATGISKALVLVIAKDMVAAFKEDAIFEQSGSLCWYAETLSAEPGAVGSLQASYEVVHLGAAEPGYDPRNVAPLYFAGKDGEVILPVPGDPCGWSGKNKEATGRFNPCGKALKDGSYIGCRYVGNPEVCK